jgi:hypothetical protein
VRWPMWCGSPTVYVNHGLPPADPSPPLISSRPNGRRGRLAGGPGAPGSRNLSRQGGKLCIRGCGR